MFGDVAMGRGSERYKLFKWYLDWRCVLSDELLMCVLESKKDVYESQGVDVVR